MEHDSSHQTTVIIRRRAGVSRGESNCDDIYGAVVQQLQMHHPARSLCYNGLSVHTNSLPNCMLIRRNSSLCKLNRPECRNSSKFVLCFLLGDTQGEFYEGWNFNTGNYLFTTDTKQIHISKFYCPSMQSPALCTTRCQRCGSRRIPLAAPVVLIVRMERSTA